MGKVFLPLIYVAMLYFLPLFSVSSADSYFGITDTTISGSKFLEPTVNCVINGNYTIDNECAPLNDKDGGYMGYIFLVAVAANIFAAALSIIGLVPFFNGLTSFFVIIAGVVGLVPLGLIYAQYQLGDNPIELTIWTYGVALVAFLVFLVGFSGGNSRKVVYRR